MKFLLFLVSFCIVSLNVFSQKRPNIILILADDMGYSDIGCYGGEVKTPTLDKLASEGIRYRQFYNGARCCPTRASLMTGLYPHQAGMGWMAAADLGTPAYQGNLNKESVTIAEVLRSAGYSTYMTGKWHLTNERKIEGEVIDNWPAQRGFEKFFGIIPGAANYFTPFVYSNNARYKAPGNGNYYLTDAISDTSVKYLNEHFTADKNKPLFMYVAYNAPHWPLHAPKASIEKYKNLYLKGWDQLRQERMAKQRKIGLMSETAVLSPRDGQVPAWNTLSEKEKEEMASRMAIYAAQIDIMDQGIGRIVKALKDNHQLDNTLIFFLSDNGACAEFISSGKSKAVDGTADTYESYRINWANVSSTPFREYKHFTHEGGIATPLIVHWPKGVSPGLNNSFAVGYGQLTDIMATCVDVAKAKYPATFEGNKIHPLEGKSLAPHFSGTDNKKGKMYWEHEANIAMRDGKWKLVAKTPEDTEFDKSKLQLFDLDADPSEMNDLAGKNPSRVASMYEEWLGWAKRINAFPFDTREYGARMQAYRRNVNGSFDDNLGGWNVKLANDANASVTIDNKGKINGNKAALITMNQTGGKPNNVAMFWPVKLVKGEKFSISLKAISERPTEMLVRFEKVDDPAIKAVDARVAVANNVKNLKIDATPVPADGNYRIALYFGNLKKGDKVWVDDVNLMPVK